MGDFSMPKPEMTVGAPSDAPLILQRTDKFLFIKGFVSFETPDRLGLIANARGFNTEAFLARSTVYVNHKPWNTLTGNSVSVGIFTDLYPAVIRSSREDSSVFNVISLNNRSVRNTYPKDKIPGMKAGTIGLFGIARISEPDVIQQVELGQLSAFSWKGFSKVSQVLRGTPGTVYDYAAETDLSEISLVNDPVHGFATFLIGRGFQAEEGVKYLPKKVEFDHGKFTVPQIKEWARGFNFEGDLTRSKSKYRLSLDSKFNEQDPNVVTYSLDEGVTVTLIPETKPVQLQSIDTKNLCADQKGNFMADQDPVVLEIGEDETIEISSRPQTPNTEISRNILLGTGAGSGGSIGADGISLKLKKHGDRLRETEMLSRGTKTPEETEMNSTEIVALVQKTVTEQLQGPLATLTESVTAISRSLADAEKEKADALAQKEAEAKQAELDALKAEVAALKTAPVEPTPSPNPITDMVTQQIAAQQPAPVVPVQAAAPAQPAAQPAAQPEDLELVVRDLSSAVLAMNQQLQALGQQPAPSSDHVAVARSFPAPQQNPNQMAPNRNAALRSFDGFFEKQISDASRR